MSYLVWAHYAPTPEGGSFCDIGEGLSCDIVNKSAYSEVFGVPLSAIGVGYFAVVFALGVWRYTPASMLFVASFMIALLGPSLYLTATGKAMLNNICILCETSKTLMAIIAATAIAAVGPRTYGAQRGLIALAIALVLASALYVVHSAVVVNPFSYTDNRTLAEFFSVLFK